MSEEARTLGEIAPVVRSKNAGPFWMTLDVFFRSDADFAHVRDARVLTAERIGELYGVDAALVKTFELPVSRSEMTRADSMLPKGSNRARRVESLTE